MNAGPVQGALSSPLDTRVGRAGRLRRPRTLDFVWTSCRPPAHLTWLHTPHPQEVGWIPARDTPHLESPISWPHGTVSPSSSNSCSPSAFAIQFLRSPRPGVLPTAFPLLPALDPAEGREEYLRTRWFEVELQ